MLFWIGYIFISYLQNDNSIFEGNFSRDFPEHNSIFVMIHAFVRNNHPEVVCIKSVFKSFAKFTWKHLWQSFLFHKIASSGTITLSKRDSGAGVFLSILRNFSNHIFYKTPVNGLWFMFAKNSDLWLVPPYNFYGKQLDFTLKIVFYFSYFDLKLLVKSLRSLPAFHET